MSYSTSSSYETIQSQQSQAQAQQQHSHNEESETTQLFFVCFSAILVVILFLSRILENYVKTKKYLSEPAMTLLVGMLCSWLIREFYHVHEEDLTVMDVQHYNADDEYAANAANANAAHATKDDDDDYNYNIKYYYSYEGDDDDANLANKESEFVSVDSELPSFFLYFPSKIFFLALLPPILFNSGYQLQRELFYRHFFPIALFAVVGTFLNAFGAGGLLVAVQKLGWMGGGGTNSSSNDNFQPSVMELLTFGSLIAATDTVSVVGVLQRKRVDPRLFSLVFGESALNDAVAIVRLFVHLFFCGSYQTENWRKKNIFGVLVEKSHEFGVAAAAALCVCVYPRSKFFLVCCCCCCTFSSHILFLFFQTRSCLRPLQTFYDGMHRANTLTIPSRCCSGRTC